MRKFLLSSILLLSACGYESMGNNAIGQVKRVHNETPIICQDFVDADISLGVLVNGIGSMSSQDIIFSVPRLEDQNLLKEAANSGELVEIQYDTRRLPFCWPMNWVTKVTIKRK